MFIKNLFSMLLISLLAACSSTSTIVENQQPSSKVVSPEKKDDLWDITRENFEFTDSYNKPRVLSQIKYYSSYPPHLLKVSAQATPFYHYILNEILDRGFPAEVAVLPVIESLYDPTAYSTSKASGIWQFIPSTATYLGIEINDWYDGRRDVITSTQTALDYLERLNKRFDGDWMLTFAAYNGGGGTVSRAIRKNKEKGLPTDYWSLNLPKETTSYVPKILAISALIEAPEQYGLVLPSIADEAYFKEITVKRPINLNKLASLSKVDQEDITMLNAGFLKNITLLSGTHKLLVPIEHSETIVTNVTTLEQSSPFELVKYKVKSGDVLGRIASRYGSSIKMIKELNNMSSSKIRVGKTLLIPMLDASNNNTQLLASNSKSHKVHKINNGDTFWGLARRHNTSVKKLLSANGLSKNTTLRIGSSIKIPQS